MDNATQRIDEIEVRLAHQEKTISDLNDVITAQWKKIETLERQLRRLGEELAEAQSDEVPAANQKPPHY